MNGGLTLFRFKGCEKFRFELCGGRSNIVQFKGCENSGLNGVKIQVSVVEGGLDIVQVQRV